MMSYICTILFPENYTVYGSRDKMITKQLETFLRISND